MCNNINAKQNRCEYRGVAQFGRAPRSGRGGRKFESCHLDHWKAGRIGVLYEKNTCSALFKFILLKPYSYKGMNRAFLQLVLLMIDYTPTAETFFFASS